MLHVSGSRPKYRGTLRYIAVVVTITLVLVILQLILEGRL